MSKDKELEQLKQWQSEEETGPELDQNILAMAEQHVKQKERKAAGGSWWHRLRVPVSVAAGLVVTLGIARLMVNLTGENMNSMAQIANSEQMEERYAIEMAADSARQELAEKKEMAARARLSEQKMMAPPAAPQEPKLSVSSNDEQDTIVVTGSRIRAVDLESAEPVAAESPEPEQQTSGFEEHGVLDEAVLGYPLPEVWIEEIELALDEGDEITALDQWSQFKRTYPDFEVDEKLLNRIKTLQKLQENP
ncbi:hypothetical protein [Kangiella aquimarina]|uniref:Uncharacterized protein n=1 Tax=Kangiella aquimarina TaxID=261965 RepID=A0ABZ0X491_9GAMM|nr:hypothetical protein [Kangiella aquimarina]WQG85412.1 hypothetical protein SR900_00690 [Kangiella aquimarina]